MSDLHIPLIEKLKSIPEMVGIRLNEEPPYEVLLKDGDYEIRRYQRQTHASVTLQATSEEDFKQKAFVTLAKYIFGGNHAKKEMEMTSPVHLQEGPIDMAMTAPVLNTHTGTNQWTMSFVLPAKFDTVNAPTPEDSNVRVRDVPGYDAAVVRYSGNNTEKQEKRYQQALEIWLLRHPEFKKLGNFFSAQYDQPFSVPFFKRNEVQIKVRGLQ